MYVSFHVKAMSPPPLIPSPCLGCNNAWSEGSWRNVVSFLVQICVAVFFLYIIFGYYKQMQNPALRSRNQYPLGSYPQETFVGFPPPQGPPPGAYGQGSDQSSAPPYDPAKLPTYDGRSQSYSDTKDGDGLLKNGDEDPFGRSDFDHGGRR